MPLYYMCVPSLDNNYRLNAVETYACFKSGNWANKTVKLREEPQLINNYADNPS